MANIVFECLGVVSKILENKFIDTFKSPIFLKLFAN